MLSRDFSDTRPEPQDQMQQMDERHDTQLPTVWQKFLRELMEAMVLVTMVSVVSDKPLFSWKTGRAVCIVEVLTTVLETWHPEYYRLIKQGMTASAGGTLIRGPL